MTKNQRIAAWIKIDAQRRREAEVVARITRRLLPKRRTGVKFYDAQLRELRAQSYLAL